MQGENEEIRDRITQGEANIALIMARLEEYHILERQFTCNYRTLYEVCMMGIKNKLMTIQGRIKQDTVRMREYLLSKSDYLKQTFGTESVQYLDAREDILRFDDRELREKAGKYKEFLDENNEKPTKAFCRLSKQSGCNDDIAQIRKGNGEEFGTGKERGEHIGAFYSTLYKKRLDRLMEIEEFLTLETCGEDWVNNRKLTREERDQLEGEITENELDEALKTSNMGSSSGWDGISFKVIKKYWKWVGPLILKMARETFREGNLTETFRIGLIKLIPKKGNAHKVEDWRPITLLSCGYKLMSGVVSLRLGKFLMKNIGRAQKGFLREKNIGTCNLNIINCIEKS